MKTSPLWLMGLMLVTVACQATPAPATPTLPPPTATLLPPSATAVPPPTWTLTIKESVCSFDGPTTIPHAVLTINLVMDEQKPTESGYSLVTLQAGKTIEDLKAWPTVIQPDWVNLIHGVHEYTNGMHTYTYDYTHVDTSPPLYLACFRYDPLTGEGLKINAFGPFELK